MKTIRTIAKVQGMLLVLLAAGSLSIGAKALHGALHVTVMATIIHLLSGGWLVVAGYALFDTTVYVSVAILSAMFLMLGIPEVLASSGVVANDYRWIHKVIRLVVGGLGVVGLAVGAVRRMVSGAG